MICAEHSAARLVGSFQVDMLSIAADSSHGFSMCPSPDLYMLPIAADSDHVVSMCPCRRWWVL